MTGNLPRSVLDTTGLAPARALAAWEENIGVMYDVQVANRDASFFAKVDAYCLDQIMIGECRTVAQSYERSRFRSGRDLIDCYAIQFQDKGVWTRRDGDAEASNGDVIVLDKAQPQSIAMSDSTTLHLFVPRAALAPLLHEPDGHNLQILRVNTPLASLLSGYVHQIWHQAAHLTVADAARVVQPTLQLIAAAMNGSAMPETQIGVDTALGEAVRRHVNNAVLDPGLSVDTVARDFGISRRKVYYLFEPYEGFESYVRRQRLRMVHAALRHPSQAGRPISEIAESHGFSHRKNFNDAFRRVYDLTPSQVRELARRGTGDSSESQVLARWRDWIAGM